MGDNPLPHTCVGCDNRWSGHRTAHCSVCHLTFTGVEAFDQHRHYGKCHHPVERGLTINNRSYECWGFPDDTDYNERFNR